MICKLKKNKNLTIFHLLNRKMTNSKAKFLNIKEKLMTTKKKLEIYKIKTKF